MKNYDYLHMGIAILGCFLMSFCVYSELYQNNVMIWHRLAYISLLFTGFYIYSFKDCSRLFETA